MNHGVFVWLIGRTDSASRGVFIVAQASGKGPFIVWIIVQIMKPRQCRRGSAHLGDLTIRIGLGIIEHLVTNVSRVIFERRNAIRIIVHLRFHFVQLTTVDSISRRLGNLALGHIHDFIIPII